MKKNFLISILICFMVSVFSGVGGSPPINKQEIEKSFISDADVSTVAEIVLIDQYIMVNIQGVGISPGDNQVESNITKNIRVEQYISSLNSDSNKLNKAKGIIRCNNKLNVLPIQNGKYHLREKELEMSPGDLTVSLA